GRRLGPGCQPGPPVAARRDMGVEDRRRQVVRTDGGGRARGRLTGGTVAGMAWGRLRRLAPQRQLAVDLGTANTVVYQPARGVVAFDPSVVAVDERSGEVYAVGAEARRMIGRTPAHITATRPLRHGVIADFEMTEQMLRHFIRSAFRRIGGGA